MRLMILITALIFSSCVTETIQPEKPRYTYTIINENLAEPFADSPCAKNAQYGITRVSVNHKGDRAIDVCSEQALRKLGPNRFAADPGYGFALLVNQNSKTESPITRKAEENSVYIVDYSEHTGINILYPLAKEGAEAPTYQPLYSVEYACEDGTCKKAGKAKCLVPAEKLKSYSQFVEKQNKASVFKKMNQQNIQKAKEHGCFDAKASS